MYFAIAHIAASQRTTRLIV